MGFKSILLDTDSSDPRSWRHLLAEDAVAFSPARPDDPAALFYTSGTTGSAKGVPLTHRNLTSQIETIAEMRLLTGEDRLLLPLPLHHVYPFAIGMLLPLALGLPIVMPQALTGSQVLRAIHDGGATAVVGVPRLYDALCSGLDTRVKSGPRIFAMLFRMSLGLSMFLRRRFGLRTGKLLLRPVHREFGSQLRIMASGGAPLDPELALKLEALGWQVAIGYGLTETSPLLTLNPPGAAKIGAVGRPLPGVEIRIESKAISGEETGEMRHTEKSAEKIGEVLARGPNVFAGYRNLPERTAGAFTADGWFRTGDLGFLDDDNYLHIAGRLSSLIVTEGGEKVQPDDVEDAYLENPVISEIGVLKKDGKLVAVIVPKLGRIGVGEAVAVEQAIRDAVRAVSAGLPSYQRIADFAVTREPLARTRMGKIRRHLLPECYEMAKAMRRGGVKATTMTLEEMSDEDCATLNDPAAKQCWDLLASRYYDKRLTPDSSTQLDLGIDSMEWLNLTLEIRQRAGVDLSEQAIGRIETVRDLLHEVSEAGVAEFKSSWLEEPDASLSAKQHRWLRPHGPVMRATTATLYALDCAAVRTLFGLRVKGLEHVPEGQPFVLIPNHLSYLDPPVLAAAIGYRRFRETYWGGWTGVMTTNPFNRLLSRIGQVIPVDPDRALISSLAFGAAVLKNGKNLVWFPEGGLSRNGRLQPFRPGIGVLLERYPTLAVPVAIDGTDRALPPDTFFPRPTPVTVEFGQPLRVCDMEKGKGDRLPERIANSLREHVSRLQQSVAKAR